LMYPQHFLRHPLPVTPSPAQKPPLEAKCHEASEILTIAIPFGALLPCCDARKNRRLPLPLGGNFPVHLPVRRKWAI